MRDRWTYLILIVGMLIGLGGSAWMAQGLQAQRLQHQLVAHERVMANMSPTTAIVKVMLGPIRPLIMSIQWMRTENLKNNGRYHEAMQLSEWITSVQPRFPKVWANRAWDLAYNISVGTHTKEERWMWVQKGMSLLRDRGIVNNPNSVLLHRELGWLFLHKVGSFSDDMHWYYKQQLADQWHRLLGAPVNDEPAAVIEAFRPIAEAYEKYLNRYQLTRAMQQTFAELLEHPSFDEQASKMALWRSYAFDLFKWRIKTLAQQPSLSHQVRQPIDQLLAQIAQHEAAIQKKPLARFLEDYPEARELIGQLAAMGYDLDQTWLADVAMIEAQQGSSGDWVFIKAANTQTSDVERFRRLAKWWQGLTPSQMKIGGALLTFVRAEVLQRVYKMDPLWMLALMEGRWLVAPDAPILTEDPTSLYLPIDWRHYGAHALYWTTLGVRRSYRMLRPEDADVLNTDRISLHALQTLRNGGRLLYDPISRYFRQSPDPRYINAYHQALQSARQRISGDAKNNQAIYESFQDGHENFLIWSVQTEFFYGQLEKAQGWYRQLRQAYSRRSPQRAQRYSQPIELFVEEIFRDDEAEYDLEQMRSRIQGRLFQWLDLGLANNELATAEQFYQQAERLWKRYHQLQAEKTFRADRNRLALPPFKKMAADALGFYLVSPPRQRPQLEGLMRARVWRHAPLHLKQSMYHGLRPLMTQIYQRINTLLRQQGQTLQFDLERVFAPPPNMQSNQPTAPEQVQ